MSIRLSSATLGEIAGKAAVPGYDRGAVSPGIVHFGVGNFHRAHQEVYLDDLFQAGKSRDFAVLGAGMLPSDKAMADKLGAQDFLTTVVEQDNARTAARVIGSLVGFLPVGDSKSIIERLADPSIHIVSMTITEGGYFIDSAGAFNEGHPAIQADAANPGDPKTVFGLIAAGLKARRAKGLVPFTVMSCDNIPHNGKVTEQVVTGLARLSDPELADWIKANVAFPNSMVDRIVPATGKREIDSLKEAFGVEDAWPVFCEEFRQWVLEDHFTDGRPAFEEVGVTIVEDVAPYEMMKIRILNGGHASIAYPAALLDIHFVHEAMEDEQIRAFLEKLTKDEIIPIVPPVPDTSLEDYRKLIERRFSNPKIGDTIPRLAQDGSNRQPKFIVPTIRDRLAKGESIDGLALVSALWCRYLQGPSEGGKELEYNDPNIEEIRAAAKAAQSDPAAFLALGNVYGELGKNPHMVERFSAALKGLSEKGVRAMLDAYLGRT
ncbi:mannitol dehydrogenase family protein [Consotaella salsifontis]|uniref:Mannitol 2-dehydrogenase n=1 Tax=Consotaella salsifontis TaxID=1365950 RepID=A0A1T4SND7_9HYPH|nr:mannitol dehydrogenase family protein [Consotaella salsifontis]SKA29428.1 mannitol 2-dehydrogenase [Consotaella salsifontis]